LARVELIRPRFSGGLRCENGIPAAIADAKAQQPRAAERKALMEAENRSAELKISS